MEFNTDFSSTNFGIVGTEENVNVDVSGASGLFSDPNEVKPIEEKEEEKEVTPPTTPKVKKDSFAENLGGPQSGLFDGEEEDTEEEQVPQNVDTPSFESPTEEVEEETSEDSEPDNQFNNIAQDLYDAGIFAEGEDGAREEINTPEELLAKFQETAKGMANQELNKFFTQRGQGAWEAVKAILIDGVDAETYFTKTSNIESFQNLDLDNESNQESVVKQYYKHLGWSDERINKKVEKLKDYGDLSDEAQVASEKLTEVFQAELENERLLKQQQDQAKLQQQQYYESNVANIINEKLKAKDFDGIPVTDGIANKTFDFMTTRKWTIPSTGENITDFDKFLLDLKLPQNYDKAVKIALLEQSGWDFSKIKTKAISQESNKLFQRAMQKEKVAKRKAPTKTDNFII